MSLLWSAAVKAFLRIFSGMRSFWAACAVAASALPYHVAMHASMAGPGGQGSAIPAGVPCVSAPTGKEQHMYPPIFRAALMSLFGGRCCCYCLLLLAQ